MTVNLDNVNFRPSTGADIVDLPSFDFTKLTAINTCPRWGLVRYDQHKRMPGEGRAMSLELGQAAQEAFAAIRLYELMTYGSTKFYPELQVMPYAAKKCETLFGKERAGQFAEIFAGKEDERIKCNRIATMIVNTGGFYDDPQDKRRTLTNLENSLFAYIDRHEFGLTTPFFDEATGFIGIEIPIDFVIEFDDGLAIRYIGKIDGLTWDGHKVRVEENKTASRLDRAWQESWAINHQPTGYCVAASLLTGQMVDEGVVRGMMVPLPKTYDSGGIVNIPIYRDGYRIREWLRWIHATVTNLYLPFKDDPLNAPEFTHSCNRYFRPCSFIPLCAMAEPEERQDTFENMVYDKWNPLDERTAD